MRKKKTFLLEDFACFSFSESGEFFGVERPLTEPQIWLRFLKRRMLARALCPSLSHSAMRRTDARWMLSSSQFTHLPMACALARQPPALHEGPLLHTAHGCSFEVSSSRARAKGRKGERDRRSLVLIVCTCDHDSFRSQRVKELHARVRGGPRSTNAPHAFAHLLAHATNPAVQHHRFQTHERKRKRLGERERVRCVARRQSDGALWQPEHVHVQCTTCTCARTGVDLTCWTFNRMSIECSRRTFNDCTRDHESMGRGHDTWGRGCDACVCVCVCVCVCGGGGGVT